MKWQMTRDLLLSVTLVPKLFLGEPCSDRGYCPRQEGGNGLNALGLR